MERKDGAAASVLPDCAAILDTILDHSATGIAIAEPGGRILHANRTFCEMLGHAPGECEGLALLDLAPPDAAAEIKDRLCQLATGEISFYRVERAYPRKGGGQVWGRSSVSTVRDARTGHALHLVIQLEDIGQRKAAEAALAESEKRWNNALEAAGQGVWDSDIRDHTIFYSRMWKTIRGIDPRANVPIAAWEERVHPEDHERVLAEVGRHDRGEIPSFALEYRERHQDGHWIWILSRGKAVEWNADGTPARVIGTDTDITRLKDAEARRVEDAAETFRQNLAKLEKAHAAAEAAQQLALSLARHDALTGLPNRRVFAEALEKAVARSVRESGRNVVLLVDLDRFKPVNDIHGHATGDAVLCEVAKRLQEVIRAGDTVARMGGDEFAIIMECGSGDSPADSAIQLARRVIETVSRSVVIDDRVFDVGASVGLAICPSDGQDPETLLRAADMAMYRAKEEGRGTFRFFQSSMEAQLRARADLEEDVRRAVAQGDIVPFYQPLMQLSENKLVGFEVLARWHHPVRGDVPPDAFIPVLEQLGLIAEFTYKLLRRACVEARAWPQEITLSVNLSPLHLGDPVLPVKLLAILSETGFPPNRLEIEITEGAVARDVDMAKAAIATLQGLGIKISLDDFGMGYSSLYQLREYHFDKIKIDRSFVQSMEADAGSARLVRSILDLARALGLPTIAEGIEHREAMRLIMEGGGEFGQGFYFGKAMPAAEAEAMMRRDVGEAGPRPVLKAG